MLGDSTLVFSVVTEAVRLFLRSKRGSGFWASARASRSAKVWPDPAKSFSASAGLNCAENMVRVQVGQGGMARGDGGVFGIGCEAHAGL